ncbi:MAG TPA: methionyl-tRNA formyltransferase, partial [Syntrophales bacterium]|nr:methionyl-tRNA formyltransferase [Syntrophales bacterium]
MQTSVMFMGTPEFALPSLERLAVNGWPIAAVVTQPDRPRGRGRSRIAPPVKSAALRLGLPVLQPERVRDPAFLDTCRALAPDVIVVAAFGQILPAALLEIPRLGSINVHPSLLPKYRGAAPMNWTLIRGESVTGVTIMRMNEAMDAGDILIQEETAIDPREDYGALHDRLAILGAGLLARALDGIVSGTLAGIPQNP